jgi:hypothetical protein
VKPSSKHSRRRLIDLPDNKRICATCLQELPRTSDYFSKNIVNHYGLSTICKVCDNHRRNAKEKEHAYHNIPMHCLGCGDFFYTSRAALNKARKRKSSGYGRYCSQPCVKHHGHAGMTGKSWNGRRKGENNPAAILSDNTVFQIKLDLHHGFRNKDVATKYGIKEVHVAQIKSGRCWTHITLKGINDEVA